MRKFKLTILLAVFVSTASFGFAQNASDSITIPAKNISKKDIPNPTIYIGGNMSGGQTAKDILLANPFLVAKMPQYFDEIKWSVLSYQVTFVVNGKEEAPIRVTGAEFTDQIKNRIKSASSGTVIEFTDIKTQSIVGTQIVVQPLIVRIR